MPNKSKAKNSFYFFMKEVQEKEAAKGRVVTMKTLPNLAGPMWSKMSTVEREPYEELAKKFKNDPNLRGGKLASDGTRVEDNLREIEDLEKKENIMISEIKNYLNIGCLPEDEFKEFATRKMFYFISFNILCKTETEHIPIEVGVVEYSIMHGIHRNLHMIIFPGRTPTGYANNAKQLMELKHEISIYSPMDESERDMQVVLDGIKKFINPQDMDELPPLFSLEEDLEQTNGCLEWLSCKTRSRFDMDVWNAKYLLLELRAGSGYPLPSQNIALDLLTKTSFNYHPAARCDYHESKDNYNCALAYCKRLCYLLSDAVCNQFEVELTERHIPTQYSSDPDYVVTKHNVMPRNNRAAAAPAPVRLDQRNNYYHNNLAGQFDEAPASSAAQAPPLERQANVPRQPERLCFAAQMAKLKLNIKPATDPGLGIGRGQRRNN